MPTLPPTDQKDSEILILDAHSREDLHLFGSDSDASSLFDFCNRCRTEGGKTALRRRMGSPWSTAERIRATQGALLNIIERREAFARLPSDFVAMGVGRYLREVVPVIRQNNRLEFFFGAFSLWRDDQFYSKIIRGVEFTCRVLWALRSFVRETQEWSPNGELAPLVEEMRTLLERPRLSCIPDDRPGRWFWTKLRLDQTFRWHEKEAIGRLLQIIYEIDALVAMAEITEDHGFILPGIETGAVRLSAVGLVHPFVTGAVPNPLELNQDQRVLFLTGPNMAGKTTYLRAVATALYLAHLGMGVPAEKFEFVPVQCLLTSISLNDDLNDGISYFRAEALRVKAVAQAIADGNSVVAIMDEPFKGTNIKDAFDASLAILERFALKEGCLFMVSSHLIELGERLAPTPNVDYRYFEAEEQGDLLCFDYVLQSGVSSQRLGMRVLREEGVFDLLDEEERLE
jgi:DNA mismatch repair protein MutS